MLSLASVGARIWNSYTTDDMLTGRQRSCRPRHLHMGADVQSLESKARSGFYIHWHICAPLALQDTVHEQQWEMLRLRIWKRANALHAWVFPLIGVGPWLLP